MLNFIFRVIIMIVLFIVLVSTAHNMPPADVIKKMVEAVKAIWDSIVTYFDEDDDF